MKQKTKIIMSSILVIVWMIVIFYFSATPADESNNESMNIVNKVVQKFEAKSQIAISKSDNTPQETTIKTKEKRSNQKKQELNKIEISEELLILNKVIRKFAHASVYFILYILVLNLIYQIKRKYKFSYCMLSIIICFIYACTDEIHQLFVEGRTGLFSDVLIDTIGATIGWIIIAIFQKIRIKTQKSNKNEKNNKNYIKTTKSQ